MSRRTWPLLIGLVLASPALAQEDAWVVMVEKPVAAGTVDLGTPVPALRTIAKKLRLKALDAALTIDEVEIFFSDGNKQVERFGVTLEPGQATRDVELKTLLGKWVIRLELKGTATAAGRVQLLGTAGGWVTLTKTKVDCTMQRHEIPITDATRYTAIRLGVEDTALQILELTLTFATGEPQQVQVRQWIERNGLTRVVDLRGGARVLKKVSMVYKARNTKAPQATVRVYAGKALNQLSGEDQEWKRLLQRNLPKRKTKIEHGALVFAGKLRRVYLEVEGPADISSIKLIHGDNTATHRNAPSLGKGNPIELYKAGADGRLLKKVEISYGYRAGRWLPPVVRVFGQ